MRRSTVDASDTPDQASDGAAIDNQISSLLVAIESEKVPERLLQLARDLQSALLVQRQRRNPN
jgi:hypothetical protein